ncbi:hypothetical protein AOL_s00078g287 [Orbilia oligospora ATCC 24927]|uniref:Uncharacterized protein n=1 Tax=Arthrobotrys oligospora (strain ATCC 24927 / CBS 115.81 / DSM 1491) TaxID=756982 RepID=G1XBJ0_ARTOA|nr:hypothetical protein AOL_s00078g287 [Orbilia oligospora ATCC 24927]EGX49254.1 hypothetical protein AOL_s00078g287 [Orbilia oligospora ATCC 24927]
MTHEIAFTESIRKTITAFDFEPNGYWSFHDYTGNGTADLIYIKTKETGSGCVEIHVASSESNYEEFALQIPTVFEIESEPPENGTFVMGHFAGDPKPDLIFIKTKNTGTHCVEVHVASAASDYQEYYLQTPSVFAETGANLGTWTMADFNGDGSLDLIYIRTRSIMSGCPVIWVAGGFSDFQKKIYDRQMGVQAPTTGRWTFTRNMISKKLDFVWVNTGFTASGKVEVFVLPGSNGYQRWGTAFQSTFDTNYYNDPISSVMVAKYTEDSPFCLVQVKWGDTTFMTTELEVLKVWGHGAQPDEWI